MENEKYKKIKKEKSKLLKIFKEIDENKKKFISSQIDDLAWLIVSIKELQEEIDYTGTIVDYDNGGGQKGVKDNPNIKTLIAYQKNANAIYKMLIDLVPNATKKSKLEAFMNG